MISYHKEKTQDIIVGERSDYKTAIVFNSLNKKEATGIVEHQSLRLLIAMLQQRARDIRQELPKGRKREV